MSVAARSSRAPEWAMRFVGWLGFMLVMLGEALAVHYGQSKESLFEELGRPTSVLAKGDREVLLYPNGGRIELQGGRVVLVQKIEVHDGPRTANTPAPNAEKAPEVKPAKPADEDIVPTGESLFEKNAAAERAKFEKALEDLAEPPSPQSGFAHAAFSLKAFLTELALKWLLMVAALKLTCKYWAVEIEWSGLLIAALADTAVRAGVLLLVENLMGMPSAFYADEAIGAIVLVLVLKKVSFNQSTAQAVQITMTSKVFSIVVGSFLSVVVLRALN